MFKLFNKTSNNALFSRLSLMTCLNAVSLELWQQKLFVCLFNEQRYEHKKLPVYLLKADALGVCRVFGVKKKVKHFRERMKRLSDRKKKVSQAKRPDLLLS